MASASLTLELTRVDDAGEPYALRGGPQRYLLRMSEGRYTELALDWSEALRQELAAAAQGEAGAAALGARLRGLLAGAPELLRRLDADEVDEVVLLSGAAELYGLPWELLPVGEAGSPLGVRTSLRYAWPQVQPEALASRSLSHPGRVLLAWSEAGGAVPHAPHLGFAEAAWREASLPEAHAPEALAHASLSGLKRMLRRKGPPTRVLQLLCHGRRTPKGPELLMGTREDPDPVSPTRLVEVLGDFAGELRLVVLTVCESADAAGLDPSASLARALHLVGIEAVVGARAPLRFGDAERLMKPLWGALTGTGSVQEGVAEARAALRLERAAPTWAQLQLYASGGATRPLHHRPYRGLLGYSQRDAALFFGRAAEIEQLLSRVQAARQGERAPPWLFVVGPSGSGKSSLVRAGLWPRLLRESDEHWILEELRPGAALPEPQGPTLLLVDQLEELFTRVETPEARQTFVSAVLQLLERERGRVVAVGTLRSDYLERVREVDLPGDRGFDELVFKPEALLQLTPMGRTALAQVVSGPAAVVGLELEEDLVDAVTSQVAGEPGALPLVAHAMDQLWLRREGLRLTKDALKNLDGVVGALARSADGVLQRMDPEGRVQARRLLVSMVKVEQGGPVTRQLARLDELHTGDAGQDLALDAAAEALVEARLLVRGADARGPTLEIAHEALLHRWGWLREQVEEDRQVAEDLDRLSDWYAEHLRQVGDGRPGAGLLKGPQLRMGQDLVEGHSDRVPRSLREFVQQSAVAAAADLRRRRYDPLAAFVGLLIVSVFVPFDLDRVWVQLPLAVAVSLVAWARWAVFSELRARYDIEGFLQAMLQAVVLISMSARGLHDELADWDTAVFMAVGVLGMWGMVTRLMQRAELEGGVTKAGIAAAGGLWLLAGAAQGLFGVEDGAVPFVLLALAACLVEGGTWFGLVGKRLPPTHDGGQLWRILRDGQTFSALAAMAFLMFIYGGRDNGEVWRESNLGLSVALLALMLTINSLSSLGRDRGDTPARVRAWHIGQSGVALGMVIPTLGFARLLDQPVASSPEGRWMAGLGLVIWMWGLHLRRPHVEGVVPLRTPAIGAVSVAVLLWAWKGGGLTTWVWMTPLVAAAAVALLIAFVEVGVEGEDSWRAPARR